MKESGSNNARRGGSVDARLQSLDGFFHEVAVVFHRMSRAAEELHGQGAMSGGRRSILRELERGPRTVPQMARARSVSRQHIQILVNDLAQDGHVERAANPEHKRSPLVCLTAPGHELVAEMNRREAKLLPNLALELDAGALEAAAGTLRAVRRALDGERWKRHVQRVRRAERSPGSRATRESRRTYRRVDE